MLKFAAEFGLTPVARSRISAVSAISDGTNSPAFWLVTMTAVGAPRKAAGSTLRQSASGAGGFRRLPGKGDSPERRKAGFNRARAHA
jgi:hypothetical protein